MGDTVVLESVKMQKMFLHVDMEQDEREIAEVNFFDRATRFRVVPVSKFEEVEKAENALAKTELIISRLLDTLTSTKPGDESAKHRAIAQKYDLKATRELIVRRTEWNRPYRNECIIEISSTKT